MRRAGRIVALLGLFLALAACNPLRRPVVPLPTVDFAPAAAAGGAGALIVCLPGLYDRPHDFERSGVIEVLRRQRPDATVVVVDAHFGYYRQQTILDRLLQDVLQPARQRGHEEIWLVGVSLGGFGSLLSAERRPDVVTGVVALAPYVGPRELLRAIAAAGGPRAWQASDPEDTMQRLWLWLRREPEAGAAAAAEGRRPRLFLGYGRNDRAAGTHATLAGLLPDERVAEVDGGHDWKTWRKALEVLLERGALARPRP